MSITIYHNPRCSKSRQALQYLTEQGLTPVIHLYLKDPLDQAAIKSLLAKLNRPAIQMMRSKEALFKELALESASDEQLIAAMLENPSLIERPIIELNDNACIARPIDDLIELLS